MSSIRYLNHVQNSSKIREDILKKSYEELLEYFSITEKDMEGIINESMEEEQEIKKLIKQIDDKNVR